MAIYQPEIGQAVFGQPHQQFECPIILEAALSYLRYDLERARWNVHQKECNDPFGNTGESFECDEFRVEAYSWNDDYEQPFNFKWRDIEIGWYKYLGRGMSVNREVTADEAAELLRACLAGVERWEKANDRNP